MGMPALGVGAPGVDVLGAGGSKGASSAGIASRMAGLPMVCNSIVVGLGGRRRRGIGRAADAPLVRHVSRRLVRPQGGRGGGKAELGPSLHSVRPGEGAGPDSRRS